MRFAEPRFRASTMTRVSMIHVLMGEAIDWITNASEPRTDSLYRTKTSPEANSKISVGVGATPSTLPISSARAGYARPEKSIRVLRFSELMLFIDVSPSLVERLLG